MLIVVDIGNTNMKLAFFKAGRKVCIRRLNTEKAQSAKRYEKILRRILPKMPALAGEIEDIVICSVVPSLTPVIASALSRIFKISPLILGKDIKTPIKNRYRRPGQVGQDRLVNALAAARLYGAPAIVIDFGTALTFDVISKKGEYVGGIIAPGIELALKALADYAELLPKINLGVPKDLIGKETSASIRSGIVNGYSFLVEGMIKQLRTKIKGRVKVIATGGWASFMSRFCPSIDHCAPDLTLHGIRIGYKLTITSDNRQ